MKLMTMLESSTMIPLPGLGAAGKAIPLTLTQREKKGGQRSATGHQSMKTSSPGKVPQQSFKLGLSQRSTNALTSLRTGQLIPPMWSGRSSSHLDAQTFPPDQWLNIVKGFAVNLAKVLGAHYSTDVEAKQSQDLGELFQISIRVPKQSKAITTHGDRVITFGKTIQAITFTMPGRHAEYIAYQAYLSALFASVSPSFHSRVLDLDKAIRL